MPFCMFENTSKPISCTTFYLNRHGKLQHFSYIILCFVIGYSFSLFVSKIQFRSGWNTRTHLWSWFHSPSFINDEEDGQCTKYLSACSILKRLLSWVIAKITNITQKQRNKSAKILSVNILIQGKSRDPINKVQL